MPPVFSHRHGTVSLQVPAQRMEEETNTQSTNLPKNSTKPMDNSPLELLAMPLQKRRESGTDSGRDRQGREEGGLVGQVKKIINFFSFSTKYAKEEAPTTATATNYNTLQWPWTPSVREFP